MPVAVEIDYGAIANRPDCVTANVGSAARGARGHIQNGIVRSGIARQIRRVVPGYAAENFPLVIEVVIDALGKVVVTISLYVSLFEVVNAGDVVAWIVGSPERFYKRGSQRIESRRGNQIAGEGRAG